MNTTKVLPFLRKTGKVYVNVRPEADGAIQSEEDLGRILLGNCAHYFREAHQLDVLADILKTQELMQRCADRIVKLNRLFNRARPFDVKKGDKCPGCYGSEYPGRIYNNNDTTSGQFFNCKICNPEGDLSA